MVGLGNISDCYLDELFGGMCKCVSFVRVIIINLENFYQDLNMLLYDEFIVGLDFIVFIVIEDLVCYI